MIHFINHLWKDKAFIEVFDLLLYTCSLIFALIKINQLFISSDYSSSIATWKMVSCVSIVMAVFVYFTRINLMPEEVQSKFAFVFRIITLLSLLSYIIASFC